MNLQNIEQIVIRVLHESCTQKGITIDITKDTPLIGTNSVLDSMGLVNFIVDTETAFLDEDIEISLTSEAAMSSRISPFRTVGAMCNFIAKQLGVEENE